MRYNVIALACAILLALGVTIVQADFYLGDTDGDSFHDPSATITWVEDDPNDDVSDNCPDDFNWEQGDSDSDGYGNACDANFDNVGKVGPTDFSTFKATFNLGRKHADYDDQANHDCIGKVEASDYSIFQGMFNETQSPGAQCADGSKAACGNAKECVEIGNHAAFLMTSLEHGHGISAGNTKDISVQAWMPPHGTWPEDGIAKIRMTVYTRALGENHDLGITISALDDTDYYNRFDCSDWISANVPADWECEAYRVGGAPTREDYMVILDGLSSEDLLDEATFSVTFADLVNLPIKMSETPDASALDLWVGWCGMYDPEDDLLSPGCGSTSEDPWFMPMTYTRDVFIQVDTE